MGRSLTRLALVAVLLFGIALRSQDASSSPQSPPPQRPARVRISQKLSQTFVIKKVPPEYSDEARRRRIKGNVLMQVEISPEGDVTDAKLISGDPALAPSALAAVKQWKYKPYLLNNQPVAVETQVTVAYSLSSR